MAFEIFKLFGSIFVDTSEANNEMDRAGNNAEILGKKFKTVADTAGKIEDVLSGLGKGLTKYVTAPLTAATGIGLKLAMDFDAGMSEVKAVVGATGKEFDLLREKALDLGGSTSYSAGQVANAMTEMAKAGWTTQQILDGMGGVLAAAAASGEELGIVSTIVADAITGFGLAASDSTRVADLLTQAANGGTIGIGDLGESFKYIAPVAATMGYSIEDTTTALAAMSTAGIKGSQSGTSLRGMLTRMAKPTDQVATAMDVLKISLTNTDGSFKGLDQTLAEMRVAFAGLTDEQKAQYAATLAGQEGMSGLLSLLNMSQSDYDSLAKSMDNCGGVAEETAAIMKDNLKGDLEELTGALETLAIKFADVVVPVLRDFVNHLTVVVTSFTDLDDSIKGTIMKIGLVAAAIGPVLLIFGGLAGAVSNVAGLFATGGLLNGALGSASAAFGLGAEGAVGMGSSLAALTGPVAIVVAVIAGLVALLVGVYQSSETFRNSVSGAFESIKNTAQDAFGRISEALGPAMESFQGFATGLTPVLQQIGDFIGTYIVPVVEQFIRSFINGFANIIVAIAPFVAAIGKLLSFIGNFVGLVVALLNGDWAGAWQFAQAMGQNAVDFLVNVFQGLYNWVSLIFQSILDFIVGIWTGIVQRTTETWNGIVTFLQTAWQLIYDNTIGKITELATTIANKWQDTKTDTQQKWDAIKRDLATKWEEIKTNISNKVQEVATNLANKWQETKTDTQQKWTDIKTDLANKWEDIKSNIANRVQEVATNLANKWQETKTDTQQKWADIKADLAEKWENIKTNVSEKAQETFKAVSDKWQETKADSTTRWGEIRDDLTQKAREIFQNVTDKAREIAEDLPRRWETVKRDAGEWWDGIKTRIYDAIKGLPGDAKDIAIGMLNEMVKGIQETAENVYGAVTGLVNQVITKFKEGFGIHSPARVMLEIGKYIVQGLINGLNGDNLMAFVNSMVEDIKSAFANGNFNLKAAIDFVGSGAAEFFKSIGIGGSDFGSLVAPVSGGITSWFGYRDDVGDVGSRYHEGIDIGVPEGTPVGAAGGGTVTQAGWYGGYGNAVIIDHGNGLETLYGHLSEVLVNVGDLVNQLQLIGLSGNTGNSTGPHLHFSVIKDGVQVDPASIFGYASGTNYATAGLHWVGEKGPELVNFKGGESVYDAETSELLAKGNVTMEVTINSPTPLSPAKTAKLLKRSVQELLMN